MKNFILTTVVILTASLNGLAQSQGGGDACHEPCGPGKFKGYDQHGGAIIQCMNANNSPCVRLADLRTLSELKSTSQGRVEVIGESGQTVHTIDFIGYGGWWKDGRESIIKFIEKK